MNASMCVCRVNSSAGFSPHAHAHTAPGPDTSDQGCADGGRRTQRGQQGVRLHTVHVQRGGQRLEVSLLNRSYRYYTF